MFAASEEVRIEEPKQSDDKLFSESSFFGESDHEEDEEEEKGVEVPLDPSKSLSVVSRTLEESKKSPLMQSNILHTRFEDLDLKPSDLTCRSVLTPNNLRTGTMFK